MPLFSPILRSLEEHIKETRRSRLRHRAMVVVAQDRVDRLEASTGWRPAVNIVYRNSAALAGRKG